LVRLDESHAGRSNLTAVVRILFARGWLRLIRLQEVMSMLLGRARGIASFSSVSGKDVVLAVPPFLTHQERQNLIEAAKLGGLNIVSMMSDVAAGWAS
jgi:molecular chaperone DnaK (HSP70)